jgi:hypothetical protein
MITQGNKDFPAGLNDHIFGLKLKEVHWGGFAVLELTYPQNFDWDFLIETKDDPTATPPVVAIPPAFIAETETADTFKVNDVINRAGVDPDVPIIRIKFDENNPISEESAPSGFTYQNLFAEWAPLQLFPPVEVIDPIERFRIEDQATVDAFIEAYNATETARADDSTHVSLQADIISNFLSVHPDGTILRNVTDFRDVEVPEPDGGWGTISISYLPLPWQTTGSVFALFSPDGYQTFSYPGWQFNYPHSITGFPPFLPVLVGSAYGKYPNIRTEERFRDCYAVNLSKLGNRIVSIRLFQQTANTNSAVQINFFTGGGTWSAAEKRTVISSSPLSPPSTPPLDPVSHMVKTSQTANGRDTINKVIAKFDRHGFVPLT